MTVLAYIPSPPQGVWHLGPLPIRAYALLIIIGIVVALMIGDRRWVARGGDQGVVYDVALWAVPFGLIGGRLYHVITDWNTYFGEGGAGFVAALKIWDGGLGIWGAVALGGVGAWIACRRRGIPLPAFGDAVAPGIILAQAIGRLGNYFNQELYGRETTRPWGLEIYERLDPSGLISVHSIDGVSTGQVAGVVHPTFLYELLWNVLVFVLLIWADRRFNMGHGRLFALYVAGYCVGRFWVELLRDDAATLIAGIRINSFTSTFVFIGAVVYMILAPKGREAPETLSVKEHEEEAKKAAEADEELAEWTKELARATATTGVVAGVVVAAQDEDAAESEDSGTEGAETAEAEVGEPVEEGPGVEAVVASAEGEEPISEVAPAEGRLRRWLPGSSLRRRRRLKREPVAEAVVASAEGEEPVAAEEPVVEPAEEAEAVAAEELVEEPTVEGEPVEEPVGEAEVGEPVEEPG